MGGIWMPETKWRDILAKQGYPWQPCFQCVDWNRPGCNLTTQGGGFNRCPTYQAWASLLQIDGFKESDYNCEEKSPNYKERYKFNYYPIDCRVIKQRLIAAYPEAQPVEGIADDIVHTLWMIDMIQSENKQFDNQGKIDLWFGWILAKAHSLKLIDGSNIPYF